MKSLILKVTSMRKLTISVDNMLLDLNDMIFIEIDYIHKDKLSITLKYHLFDVVTFEIFDFEGHKYEGFDCFNWYVIQDLNNILYIEINYIHESKSSIILKYL